MLRAMGAEHRLVDVLVAAAAVALDEGHAEQGMHITGADSVDSVLRVVGFTGQKVTEGAQWRLWAAIDYLLLCHTSCFTRTPLSASGRFPRTAGPLIVRPYRELRQSIG